MGTGFSQLLEARMTLPVTYRVSGVLAAIKGLELSSAQMFELGVTEGDVVKAECSGDSCLVEVHWDTTSEPSECVLIGPYLLQELPDVMGEGLTISEVTRKGTIC